MKDKILMLVLGILIGAVVTAGGFLIFSNNKSPEGDMQNMRGQFDTNSIPGDRGSRGDLENMTPPQDAQTNSI